MKRSLFSPVVLLAYAITVAVGIEAINAAWGNLLPNRDGPQYGSGFGKMRGTMGEFQNVLLLLGSWVYPACVIAATQFVRCSFVTQIKAQKLICLLCAGMCVLILLRFFYLKVFLAGIGLDN